ncbi:hypothetical protein [Laceyella putida]|uniref:Uncharacterized protein n=1 Tax=Laceyella putida TaxID=110101 RepID=A0ABW2RIJ9_9BACL
MFLDRFFNRNEKNIYRKGEGDDESVGNSVSEERRGMMGVGLLNQAGYQLFFFLALGV